MKSLVLACTYLLMPALGACATQSAVQFTETFERSKHYLVRIEPCQDRTGFVGRDLASEATGLLKVSVRLFSQAYDNGLCRN